jgi:hypothetical protein
MGQESAEYHRPQLYPIARRTPPRQGTECNEEDKGVTPLPSLNF